MFTITVNEQYQFDDAERGIKDEPFIAGADAVILLAAIAAGAKFPVTVDFDSKPFKGAYKAKKFRDDPEQGGAHYATPFAEAWLCPCTLKFFGAEYPKAIYFKVHN